MLSFEDLKKNRGKKGLESLTEELKKVSTSGSKEKDDRFWYPDVDKVGNGYAVIRFLPPPLNEVSPFVKVWSHSFKGQNGSWYIENCLSTIGQEDPILDANRVLWNSGTDENKEKAREQKRKLAYIANIQVVKDPAHPENEGKTFLFKFGAKIFDKIKAKCEPVSEHDEQMNPFDAWEGMNLKLKIRQKDGYRNYDDSEWASQSAISSDDEKIKAIWESTHSLKAFVDPKNFKSYAELKERYNKVNSTPGESSAAVEAEKPSLREKREAAPHKSTPAKSTPVDNQFDDDVDEDFLAKIAEA